MTGTHQAIQAQALFMAAVGELIVGGLTVLAIAGWRGAVRGDIARDSRLNTGVRTESTLRSEQTWIAGNRAALRTAPWHVVFNVALSVALFAAAWHGWRLVVCLVTGAGFFAFIGLMTGSGVVAGRAARAVGGPKEPFTRPAPQLEGPAITANLSERDKTILAWVCAALGCGLTLLLLGSLIHGYTQALHHELVPAGRFGFRDGTTTECWARWYPSQITGLRWVLFSYGPLLVAALFVLIGAARQRRPPRDFLVLIPGIVFAALPFVIVAAIHAHSVASAITC